MKHSKIKISLLPILLYILPLIVFFILNILTPYWWDDFIYGCSFTQWHEPHTTFLSSFSDVLTSTRAMYQTWNGRTFSNFINVLFVFFRNKTIFNICNTFVYGIFVLLVGFHVTGSVKKISAMLYTSIHILLWFALSRWGQNLLWLTGSCNYLWTSMPILLFLVPFRKKAEDSTYRVNKGISGLWLIPGILAGWSMENSASGVFVLLVAYFIVKSRKKEPFALFEFFGTLGFLFGFFMLINARSNMFPGFFGLIKNAVTVAFLFIVNDAFLLGIIVCLAVELLYFRKISLSKINWGYFVAALATVVAMIIPGYFGKRSEFMTQVFLIITLLSLVMEIKQFVPGRYVMAVKLALILCFIPSFYSGCWETAKSFLYEKARNSYILSEKQKGNLELKVKTPIPVFNSRNPMYDSIDILDNPEDHEYTTHNSAKVTWYGLQSLDGVPALRRGSLTRSIEQFLDRRKQEQLTVDDLFLLIYEGW